MVAALSENEARNGTVLASARRSRALLSIPASPCTSCRDFSTTPAQLSPSLPSDFFDRFLVFDNKETPTEASRTAKDEGEPELEEEAAEEEGVDPDKVPDNIAREGLLKVIARLKLEENMKGRERRDTSFRLATKTGPSE